MLRRKTGGRPSRPRPVPPTVDPSGRRPPMVLMYCSNHQPILATHRSVHDRPLPECNSGRTGAHTAEKPRLVLGADLRTTRLFGLAAEADAHDARFPLPQRDNASQHSRHFARHLALVNNATRNSENFSSEGRSQNRRRHVAPPSRTERPTGSSTGSKVAAPATWIETPDMERSTTHPWARLPPPANRRAAKDNMAGHLAKTTPREPSAAGTRDNRNSDDSRSPRSPIAGKNRDSDACSDGTRPHSRPWSPRPVPSGIHPRRWPSTAKPTSVPHNPCLWPPCLLWSFARENAPSAARSRNAAMNCAGIHRWRSDAARQRV